LLKRSYLLLIVLALSLLFRITNLDLIEFKADEGINLFLASRPIFGHGFAPGGTVSSLGVTNFPLINYLLLPLVMISKDPRIISFFIALINSLAIVGFFIIVRRYYNQTIAFTSSLLMATSPWAILFSRKIWAQDFLIPLFIPFFLSFHKIVIDKDRRYWLLYAASSLFLIQIHQSALFFIFPLTAFMAYRRTGISSKYSLVGIALGLLPTVLYLLYQLRTGCFDCKMILSSSERVSDVSSPLLFLRPFQIIHQGNFFPILGENVVYFAQNFPIAYFSKYIYYAEYFLLALGAILFYKLFKKVGFIIFPVILLPFIYAFFRLEPHIHYFLIVAPFLFLFLGTSLYYLISHKNLLVKYSSITLFLCVILVSTYYNYAFYETVRAKENIKGDYGKIFEQTDRDTKEFYKKYVNDPYYEEMIIASYVPYSLSHGDIGVAKMLYDSKETEENMTILEERLRDVPIDRRIHQELIAYYTRENPSKETIRILKGKSDLNPGMIPVYEEVYNLYRERGGK
ncbi:MAG: hypothetical protein UU15_C0010G0010, partial [Candidatus Levybacteria bacterium GW2011_GWC2_40_7]